MSILFKYKKQGEMGFKKLVYKLERTLPRKREAIMVSLWLEDPVYTQHLRQNFIGLNDIFGSGGEHLKDIQKNLQKPYVTMYFAFFDTPMEKLYHQVFSEGWKDSGYEDLKYKFPNNNKISVNLRNQAYQDLFETFREMQDHGEFARKEWRYPEMLVLKGKHITYPVRGNFELYYDDQTSIALQGEIKDKLRTGEWKHFYPNGQIIASGIYHLGEREHEWTVYYEDGSLKSKGLYIEGQKDGRWLMIDQEGIEYYEDFKRGKQVA